MGVGRVLALADSCLGGGVSRLWPVVALVAYWAHGRQISERQHKQHIAHYVTKAWVL